MANLEQLMAISEEYKPDLTIAYGSGIFTQAGYDSQKSMLDFIFVVDDPLTWHRANQEIHSSDYRGIIKFLGTPLIKAMHTIAPYVYAVPYVHCKNQLIKYGVISTHDLCRDLQEWDQLFCAGRLHKPTIVIGEHDRVKEAQVVNLKRVITAALLFLPNYFDEFTLYKTIAGISYQGDIRMGVAENANKVDNIVKAQFELFDIKYREIINKHRGLSRTYQGFTKTMDNSDLVSMLHWGEKLQTPKDVATKIQRTIQRSSKVQALKGIPTAGVLNSIRYVTEKMSKFRNGNCQREALPPSD